MPSPGETTPVRVLLHDYAGHPFQVQLSRSLAARGHEVRHAYCSSTHTPRGSLERRLGDPAGFSVQSLDLGGVIPKYGYWRRLKMETAYGRLLTDFCREFQPDVVLSGNTPSIPQRRLARYCRKHGVRHVFWVQDIYGIAAYKMLSRKMPLIGAAVGRYFQSMDRTSALLSSAVVVITEDFREVFEKWGVDPARIHVIHNWSVLEELPQRERENAWSQAQQLPAGPRIIYAGTLSIKHNPSLLLELAKMLDERDDGEVVVVSEGSGVDWLRQAAAEAGVRRLRTMGFLPFEQMADCLGSADVLVVILEPDAGVFCVPSKVLSYMCAGRAILGAMPLENLAARTIADQGAGVVVAPDDANGFRAAAEKLLARPEQLAAHGQAARQYAETHFDIARITDRFEALLER